MRRVLLSFRELLEMRFRELTHEILKNRFVVNVEVDLKRKQWSIECSKSSNRTMTYS